MRILIAEDDMASWQFLKTLLSKYGDCTVAVDGVEALDAYLIALEEDNPYHIICLDIMMPKLDGIKVLKSIRDFETQRGFLPEKRVKVIMTTALDDTEHTRMAFELGCEAYLSKPIDSDKLLAVIKSLKTK